MAKSVASRSAGQIEREIPASVAKRMMIRGVEHGIDTLPEWSKGVDSSSTSASCVGSNPTGVIFMKCFLHVPSMRKANFLAGVCCAWC